jgi:predicted lipid-binding transport protein (Tim44 family)
MKRILLTTMLLGAIGGGWALAETAPTPKAPAAQMEHAGGMMGGGMMGGGMMGGMCPMMGGVDTKMAVKNIDKGVTITMTSTDASKVARLQKMAEGMRLMHEAMTP